MEKLASRVQHNHNTSTHRNGTVGRLLCCSILLHCAFMSIAVVSMSARAHSNCAPPQPCSHLESAREVLHFHSPSLTTSMASHLHCRFGSCLREWLQRSLSENVCDCIPGKNEGRVLSPGRKICASGKCVRGPQHGEFQHSPHLRLAWMRLALCGCDVQKKWQEGRRSVCVSCVSPTSPSILLTCCWSDFTMCAPQLSNMSRHSAHPVRFGSIVCAGA